MIMMMINKMVTHKTRGNKRLQERFLKILHPFAIKVKEIYQIQKEMFSANARRTHKAAKFKVKIGRKTSIHLIFLAH